MAELRRWIDRWGRPVVLHEDTWFNKITIRHPEMERYLDQVGLAIMSPDRVTFDAIFPNGENCYARALLAQPFDWHNLKVCVRYSESLEGLVGVVITAFPIPGFTRQERLKWTR
jgi:hypothetical protein